MDMYKHFKFGRNRMLLVVFTIWICLTSFLYLISIEKFQAGESNLHETRKEILIDFTPSETVKQQTDFKKEKTFEVQSVSDPYIPDDDNTTLDDIFISIKTGGKYHSTRLELILKTWWNDASKQIFIFTDIDDEELVNRTDGHIINTRCGTMHRRSDLTCKMGYEYDSYVRSEKKWWCHFDDDNYVNIANLLRLLQKYDWKSDVYIGKLSTANQMRATYMGKQEYFWFGTGGAGICISRRLSEKISSWTRNGKFQVTSNMVGVPDDCTLGFIINNRLGIELTTSNELHSHLETLSRIPHHRLSTGVSFSYFIDGSETNVIRIPEKYSSFSKSNDPTHFLSLHCLLNPDVEWCPKSKKN